MVVRDFNSGVDECVAHELEQILFKLVEVYFEYITERQNVKTTMSCGCWFIYRLDFLPVDSV